MYKSITTLLGNVSSQPINKFRQPLSCLIYAVVCFTCLAYALEIYNGGQAWKTGDWLINYEGGFVRRGLIGQIIFEFSTLGLNILWTAFAIQIVVYLLVAYYTLAFFFEKERSPICLLLLLSPAFIFLFPFYDTAGALKKEILVFLSFCILIHSRKNGRISHQLALSALIVYVIAAFSHEPSTLSLPFFIYVLLQDYNQQAEKKIQLLYAAAFSIASIASILSAVLFPGNVHTYKHICNSLVQSGLSDQICSGNIVWIKHTMTDGINKVLNFLKIYSYTYSFSFALAIIPIAISDWFWKNLLIVIIGFASLLPLFIVAYDWGRWIHIYIFFITTLALNQPTGLTFHAKRIPWVSIPIYATVWYLPSCCQRSFLGGFFSSVHYFFKYYIFV